MTRLRGSVSPWVVVAFLLPAAPVLAQQEPSVEFSPRGYVQFDWREYPDWDVPLGTNRLNREQYEARRVRVGVDGRVKRVSFELTVDPQDADGVLVKDAYAQVRFTRAFRLRVGQFKVPGGREYQSSARSIEFLERAALSESLGAGRDIGGMLTGEIGSGFDYQAGVFAGDGNGRDERAGVTGAGRAVWHEWNDIEIGGSFGMSRTEAVDTEAPNGLLGRSSSGFRFFDELYVHGWRFRSGVDGEWSPGPWRIRGEFLRADEQRRGQGLDFEDLPRAVGTGWSAEVSRQFGRRAQNPRVFRWREVDVNLRVDRLGFDDSGPSSGLDSVRARATNIRPRRVTSSTIGASWRTTPWTRVMTNATWEKFSDSRSGPRPGRAGFWAFGTRLQIEFP